MPSRLLVLTTFFLSACSSRQANRGAAPVSDYQKASRETVRVADQYWTDLIRTFPLYGVFSGAPETPNDRLGDNSIAAVRQWERKEDRWLQQVRAIDHGALAGHPENPVYGILRETLESAQQSRVCHIEYWPLNQQSGFQIGLPLLSQLQPLGTPELRRAALARWRDMRRYMDTEIQSLREGLKRGYSLPRANAAAVLQQVDALLAFAPAESPFAGMIQRDSAPGFRDSVLQIVSRDITPALRRYRTFLASEYIPRARRTTPITDLPNGAEC